MYFSIVVVEIFFKEFHIVVCKNSFYILQELCV